MDAAPPPKRRRVAAGGDGDEARILAEADARDARLRALREAEAAPGWSDAARQSLPHMTATGPMTSRKSAEAVAMLWAKMA